MVSVSLKQRSPIYDVSISAGSSFKPGRGFLRSREVLSAISHETHCNERQTQSYQMRNQAPKSPCHTHGYERNILSQHCSKSEASLQILFYV